MLNIMPKLDEFQTFENKGFTKYINDKIEIQLVSNDFIECFNNSVKVIEQLPNLKYVTLHLPVRFVDIGFICCCRSHEIQFIKLIVECIKYTSNKDLKIDILFHARMPYSQFEDANAFEFLDYIISLVQGTNVGFIMENSLHDPCINKIESDVFRKICENYSNPKLALCLDICHLQSSEYMLDCEIPLPDYIVKNIKNIHFCMTVDRSGYKNKDETHGVVHTDLEAIKEDLEYLKNKGVNLEKVNLVTEICERNEDYTNRPGMCKELKLLEELNK